MCPVADSFARFALQGRGTPAAVAPPQRLVVSGLYRYVRNPMYVSAVAVIFGQALLFGDWRLAVYAVLFWLACHAFVLVYEEPTLRRTFGAEFEDFCANVPRWIPRPRPWRAPGVLTAMSQKESDARSRASQHRAYHTEYAQLTGFFSRLSLRSVRTQITHPNLARPLTRSPANC